MTEETIKRLALDEFRVIHFATHGLLARETMELSHEIGEPALVFTPPAVSTNEDDGLLTASEIATLKLNADWVILSACNTASGMGSTDKAYEGLARAFFYAGARSILVSHWEVISDAAVKLTSNMLSSYGETPMQGKSEALKRSIQALAVNGRDHELHPSYWGPFALVGNSK